MTHPHVLHTRISTKALTELRTLAQTQHQTVATLARRFIAQGIRQSQADAHDDPLESAHQATLETLVLCRQLLLWTAPNPHAARQLLTDARHHTEQHLLGQNTPDPLADPPPGVERVDASECVE